MAADEGPPGSLGLAIDDSLVPGRLVVVEVDPEGPAGKAGVRLQDMVLAIDGEPTLDADRFAAAVAAIVPGRQTRLSIGRGGTVEEITLVASEPRPPAAPAAATAASPDFPAEPPTFGKGTNEVSPFAKEAVPPGSSAFAEEPSASTRQPAAAPGAFAAVSPPAAAIPPAAATEWIAPTVRTVPTSPRVRPAEIAEPAVPVAEPAMQVAGRGKAALGVRTVPVDPTVQARYSLPEPAGALVVGLVEDLPASRAGLPTGSVIVAFDRQPVRSPSELTRLVNEGPLGRSITLEYILPGGESRAAEVSLVALTAETTEVPSRPGTGTTLEQEDVRSEILQLRTVIESLSSRLDELERRSRGDR